MIEFKRVDPEVLAQFDPKTKQCTMNCGPHRGDPRNDTERKFLCEDCIDLKARYQGEVPTGLQGSQKSPLVH